jgi:flagellar biosynthesis chaperone FliJ
MPEIIEQMHKYQLFINRYGDEIKDYYKKLIEIKQSLGLTTVENTNLKLNKTPKLIIANTYRKMTKPREDRISDIKKLLELNNIDYEIV